MRKFACVVMPFFLLCVNCALADPVLVKIGATLPLTGRLAVAGQDARQGMELAVREFSSPSVKLEVVFDDNQHDAKLAVSSARKLLDIDKVSVLVSMWDMADVVAPIAEQRKIPHLAVRWNPHITEKYKHTLTFESTYKSYIDSLVSLLKRSGVESVASITEEGQGWILATDYLLEASSRSGIEVVGDERYAPATMDFKTIILRAIRNKPQVIVLLSNPPHTETLISQLRRSAPGQRFTGYFEIIDPKLVEHIPFPAQFEVEAWFAKKFREQFGNPPRSLAPQVYDMVHLIALATQKSGALPTPEAIMSAVADLPAGRGATGKLITSAPRVVESNCVWKMAENGEFQLFQ